MWKWFRRRRENRRPAGADEHAAQTLLPPARKVVVGGELWFVRDLPLDFRYNHKGKSCFSVQN
ncbi:hypothetical protein Heshes_24310 [Alicyclobacillus hesperidum]|uniref:Uncharacterized protein n=1 Tax=Alicyclobacillus hesperidum TaxID=89784 RepID=A0AA37TZJ9_9BACL|nr:hypothetical protein Heshes_24310 [Alicyclobacillus hesperidum]